ncbi:hypothetical protein FXB39_05095 [Nocardioides sp. BGMRC 2183]|nr:hypothetical protein FXB39_05095 [Nocardioides sp. BGMRC 2183]
MEEFPDDEGLTILIAAGISRVAAAEALGVDLGKPTGHPWDESAEADFSAWALMEIPGGVLAIEETGYGDPSLEALRGLSSVGGAAAVVRNNIQAHLRFGCAKDGELLFDADEFMFVQDPTLVPGELRFLFDLVWDDLDSDELDEDAPDGFAVGLAMAEVITGIEVSAEMAAEVNRSGFFKGPYLVYPEPLND